MDKDDWRLKLNDGDVVLRGCPSGEFYFYISEYCKGDVRIRYDDIDALIEILQKVKKIRQEAVNG